ncbi:MAG: acetyl-CoA carboxylase biotin carboxylase subunit [Caldilineales bacterium]|nr:acetyl-CoA carboxylase biotin carboxylase subunit [Caldilineales bacterium]
MFRKILITNRGEIAVRLIRACQEMGIRTVAVFSEADAGALHPALADEAVCIGPPPPLQSYLRGEAILRAAQERGCDAIHPGYGFLSENAAFAEAVAAAGLTFIGPSPAAMRAMGSKIASREAMAAAGVPTTPGYHPHQSDPAAQAAELAAAAAKIGYPILIKATAGGGGKGMRVVHDSAVFLPELESARREAQNAFGDPTVYLEKLIERPRHVEFQVLADHHGHTVHLFERECSIQRRHQKIIEETPSPALTPELRHRMGQAAVQAAQAVGYTNAGTVEFLLAPDGSFYFLEMNTRLQVEHAITEETTGIDLVKAQIRVAAGEPLPWRQEQLGQRRHAIEARIYAEDPANDFLPAVGRVQVAAEPVEPGVRVDAGVTTGDEVSIYYDPMIAKLICTGEDRADAVRKLDWALSHYTILGITTNIPFLRAVVQHPAFASGDLSTDFIERYLAGWASPASSPPDEALIAAALADSLPGATAPQAPLAAADAFSPWNQPDAFRLGGALSWAGHLRPS